MNVISLLLIIINALFGVLGDGTRLDEDAALILFPNGREIICDLADSPVKRAAGLKEYASLSKDRGLLFIYPEPRHTSFWMPPEMKFSVDIIFMDSKGLVLHIAHDAQPCEDPTGQDCESYSPEMGVSFVLEVVAGTAKAAGINVCNYIQITLPENYQMLQR